MSRRNRRIQQKLKNKTEQRFPSYHERSVLHLQTLSCPPVGDPTIDPSVDQSPTYESHSGQQLPLTISNC